MKKVLLVLVCLIVMAVLGGIALLNDPAGSHWLLNRVLPLLPGETSVGQIQGRLSDHIELTDFYYQTDTATIAAKKLELNWRPRQLLSRKLVINALNIDGLKVELKPDPTPKPDTGFDFNADFALPVQVQIQQLLITNAEIKTPDSVQAIQKLQLSLITENNQLKLTQLELSAAPLTATATGQVQLGKGYPLHLQADWQLDAAENGVWQGSSQVSGQLDQLHLTTSTKAPFVIGIDGDIKDALQTPQFAITGNWQALQWPVIAKTPQAKTEAGGLAVQGSIDNYRINLQTRLLQPDLPKTDLLLEAQGNLQGLTIQKLNLGSTAGMLQIAGKVSWEHDLEFDLSAAGKHFNPAIIAPDFPGDLSFATHIKGRQGKSLIIAADIDQLTGRLRGYPINANGKLRLDDQNLQVDAFRLEVDKNVVAVNGKLDPAQAALDFTINAPFLRALWPDLSGQLQGAGRIQGAWTAPSINAKLNGRQLKFAQHRLEQLALTVAYYPDPAKNSLLQLTAKQLKSGETVVKQLQLDGNGSLRQHNFKLDLASNLADLNMALGGSYQPGLWRGTLSRLNIIRPDIGRWQLKAPTGLTAKPNGPSWQIAFNQLCLAQAQSELCTRGYYDTNSDFQATLLARNIPASLLHPYLPPDVGVATQFNADAQVQQQRGLLTGHYDLTSLPTRLSLLKDGKAIELQLGASRITGRIRGPEITSVFDLALLGQDYIRGQLQFDTGKSQALAGHVTAGIDDFSWVSAFAPQVSAVKGHLNANIGIRGSLKAPLLNGQIMLSQGNVELPESGVALRDISLHLDGIAAGNNTLDIKLSAAPALLKDSPLKDKLSLDGLLTLTGHFNQTRNGLLGSYQLRLPAGSISLLQPEKNPLGAIEVNGHLDNERHTADLYALLVGKDFIRANAQINQKTDALSGHIDAVVKELSLLNPFAPELSNIKGQIIANLGLAGTVAQPAASGSVNLSNGSFDVNDLGVKITELRLQALAGNESGREIRLSGFARSGLGSINITGFAGLPKPAGANFEININGSNFEIARIPEAEIAISPELKFANLEGKSALTGIIKVPKAILKIEELPENAVKVSQDEIIIGREDEDDHIKVPATQLDVNIEIELGKQVNFTGKGLQTDLAGKLVVIQSNGRLSMYGNINMEKGRYKSYGQDLTIRKGRFVFNGPADNPWLEVEAIRVSRDKKVTAILGVNGPLSNPQTTVSADPAMPETEALAYLITGRPLSQISGSDGNILASAALSYGAGQASWLTDKLGIHEFDIEEGKTLNDSLLSVGQHLTPEFYVGTKVGLFNKQVSLIMKYLITERINVETQTGSNKRVKLNYGYERD